ncbi:low molecular weight phosphotyrosine protein phosphatase [Sedimentimonas flavescens]|uniref:protein-tyrosine-phosphatase n=1 Tax=Sedimentimonas flavescens TaxID=2851012 RepID=A0ABT3A2A8_9RHOB|nr:low molecular weight protein-tyrosine-phosphatase [Sedimentimonas flavescens]MCV2880092.1 low molecular weight phosphotyrosine protein phosphatase [Sedimentimonas flavescens]
MLMRILFLCLGNICRSPAAEGVFREMAARAGLEAEADSAGTGDWHRGEPPYGPMQAAASARGYDLSSLRARQLTRDDFERFDLILAMDSKNLKDAERIRPAGARAQLRLFLDAKTGTQDVPDPYYTRDFDGCLGLIEDGARRLIAVLQPPQ